MTGKKRTSREQEDAIRRMVVVERLGASQIFRALEKDGLLRDPNPEISLRTVQSRVRELSVHDMSGPWSYADADPDEARLVLDVVAEVFFATGGRVWLSKDHVAEISRLRKTVPDMPSLWADNLATAYRLCREQGRDSRHLDLAVAQRPWEGAMRADRLAQALDLPRSFRVTESESGPLFAVDSAVMLARLLDFRGSVEELGSRFSSDPLAPVLPPPDITVVDW